MIRYYSTPAKDIGPVQGKPKRRTFVDWLYGAAVFLTLFLLSWAAVIASAGLLLLALRWLIGLCS